MIRNYLFDRLLLDQDLSLSAAGGSLMIAVFFFLFLTIFAARFLRKARAN